MKIKEGGGMEDNKLWAVNIPEAVSYTHLTLPTKA